MTLSDHKVEAADRTAALTLATTQLAQATQQLVQMQAEVESHRQALDFFAVVVSVLQLRSRFCVASHIRTSPFKMLWHKSW